MNRIYKVIKNKSDGRCCVVGELVTGHGKGSVTRAGRLILTGASLGMLMFSASSLALPGDGGRNVAYGGGIGGAAGGQAGGTWGSAGAFGTSGNGGAAPSPNNGTWAPGGVGGAVGKIISADTVINSSLTGGNGTNSVDRGQFNGGGGGGGGGGVYVNAVNAVITLSAPYFIQAGNGGNGSSRPYYCTYCAVGSGGGGGNGVSFLAGGTLNNYGTIVGGTGGAPGPAQRPNNIADGGGGGHAVTGQNLVVNNYGTLTGGNGNGGGSQGAAVVWTGGNANQLNMYVGSVLNGAIWLQSGATTITEQVADRTLNNWIIFDGIGTFNTNSFNTTASGLISGSGSVVKTGTGVLTLAGNNTYSSGTTINQGTVSISSDNNLGAATGALTVNGGTLQATASTTSSRRVNLGSNGATFNTTGNNTLSLSGVVQDAQSGTPGALTKTGSGTLALSGNNTYTGTTTVTDGNLNITGSGSLANSKVMVEKGAFDISGTTSGTSVASLAGKTAGKLALGSKTLTLINAADDFAGEVTGSGGLALQSGTQTFSGTSTTYTGTTTVNNSSTLAVTGTLGQQASQVQVNAGGRLSGTGTLGGNVTVADNGTLSAGLLPNASTGVTGTGTLSIGGNLTLAQNSQLGFQFGGTGVTGGQYNDLVNVGGDLTLDGQLNVSVTPGRTFDVGIYRLFNYQGTLTSNTLDVALVPTGINSGDLFVQTSIDKQVNLVNSSGVTLRFWDSDSGTRNDGKIQGGDGTWRNNTLDNWTLADGAQNADWSDSSVAVFMGQAGDVSITNQDGDINIAGMQFVVDGYTLNNGVITLFATPGSTATQITVGDGTSQSARYVATLNSVLTGASGINKTDFGTLVLSGANTYTGDTRISDGILQVSGSTNLGDAANKLIFDGGQLATTASFTQARETEITRSGATIGTAGGTTLVQSGAISGDGALTKTGDGTLTLTGNNSWQGGTTISAGTLQVGNGGTSGSFSGDITNNGALALDRSDTFTLDGTVTGTGSLAQQGSGTSILTANNSYRGGTTIGAGTLQLGNGGTTGSVSGDITNDSILALNRSDTFMLDGVVSGTGSLIQQGSGTTVLTANHTYSGTTTISAGTLQLGNGGTTGSVSGDITNDSILALNRSDSVTFDNLVSGTGSLVHRGSGTTSLTGINTYSGGTTLSAGTVDVSANSNLGAASGGLIFNGGGLANSATFTLDRDVEIQAGNGRIASAANTVLTVTRDITGAGGLIKDGTGTTLLTGDNSYRGGTLVSAGTLQIGDGGTTGSISGDITNNGALALDRSDTFTLDGTVSGTGSLAQQGSGTSILTANNSYRGGTTISAGTLQLGNGGTTGTISGDIINNGALALNRSDTFMLDGVVSGTGSLTQQGSGTTVLTANHTYSGGTTISAGTLQLGNGGTTGSVSGDITNDSILALNRSDSVTFDNLVSGTGSLVHRGSGTTSLTGINTYSGGTTLSAGTVEVSANSNLGAASGGLIFNGGGLANSATFTLDRDVEIQAGNGRIASAANTVLTVTRDITGAGGLIKDGTGTTLLTGDNSYRGGTLVSAGTLQIGDGGTTGSISGDITNNGALALDRSDTLQLDGQISGSGSLAQQGSGTSILTANNSYRGGTTISAGTLQLGNGGTKGSVSGDITNDSILALNRSDTFMLDGVVSGTGSLTQQGSGTTVLTANHTYSGGTIISAGTLQLGNGGTTGSVSGDITNDSILALNRSDSVTFDNLVSGTGRLVHRGSGTTSLTGINTYSGGTTLSAGTVEVSANSNLGAASGGLIFNGGGLANSATFTLDRDVEIQTGNGRIASAANTVLTVTRDITGAGGLIKDGTGTTLLTGDSSYRGGTLVSAGTLQIGDGGTTGSIRGDVVSNAALVVNRDGKLTMTGALTGTGSLMKEGGGELELSGVYALTGGTFVNEGTLSFSGNSVRTNVIGQQGATLNLRNGATLDGWIDPLDVSVSKGSVWNMSGAQTQNVLDTLTLAGAVNSVAPTGGGFTPRYLTVDSLVGQNGTVTLNTDLGSDNSPSDRIIIDGGEASGITRLAVRNAAGRGGKTNGNGILVVEAQNGGTTRSGAFSLSQPVYAGMYQYSLLRGAKDGSAAENWYLTSELLKTVTETTAIPNYRPGVSTAAAIPLVSAAGQMAMMSSFYERSGYYGLQSNVSSLATTPCAQSLTLWCASESRAWGRYISDNVSRDGGNLGVAGQEGPQYRQAINGIQFGNDFWRSVDDSGNRQYAGLYAALGTSKADVSRTDGSFAGQNHLDVYSAGAYFTRIGYNDAWLDAVVQGSLLKVRSQSADSSGFRTRGYSAAASLEMGYPVLASNGWKVEPHVQALYQYQTLDSAQDGFTNVQFDDYQSVQGLAGVRISRTDSINNLRYSLWLDPGVGHEFDGDARTRFVNGGQNVPATTRTQGDFADIKAGGSIDLNKTLALYGSTNWAPRFDGAAYSWGGSVGIRGTW